MSRILLLSLLGIILTSVVIYYFMSGSEETPEETPEENVCNNFQCSSGTSLKTNLPNSCNSTECTNEECCETTPNSGSNVETDSCNLSLGTLGQSLTNALTTDASLTRENFTQECVNNCEGRIDTIGGEIFCSPSDIQAPVGPRWTAGRCDLPLGNTGMTFADALTVNPQLTQEIFTGMCNYGCSARIETTGVLSNQISCIPSTQTPVVNPEPPPPPPPMDNCYVTLPITLSEYQVDEPGATLEHLLEQCDLCMGHHTLIMGENEDACYPGTLFPRTDACDLVLPRSKPDGLTQDEFNEECITDCSGTIISEICTDMQVSIPSSVSAGIAQCSLGTLPATKPAEISQEQFNEECTTGCNGLVNGQTCISHEADIASNMQVSGDLVQVVGPTSTRACPRPPC